MSTQNKEEEVEKLVNEFEALFTKQYNENDWKRLKGVRVQEPLDWLRGNIFELLSQREATSRKELVEAIEKMKRYSLEEKHKTSKNREIRYLAGRLDDAEKAYNKAISDVLALINNK